METSMLLAKIIGPSFLVAWIWILFNQDGFLKMIEKFMKDWPLLWLTSLVLMISWLAIISTHNIWESNWTVIITVIWWAIFIKWAFFALFPKFMEWIAAWFLNSCKHWVLLAVLLRVWFWAYLTYVAYFI